jgi:hypothetical protein
MRITSPAFVIGFVAVFTLVGCRGKKTVALWPPNVKVGDAWSYDSTSALRCKVQGTDFEIFRESGAGTVDVLATNDGNVTGARVHIEADFVKERDRTKSTLVGRDIEMTRTSGRSWQRKLVGVPPGNDDEREVINNDSGPDGVDDPEDYPQNPVAIGERWMQHYVDEWLQLECACHVAAVRGEQADIDCACDGTLRTEDGPMSIIGGRGREVRNLASKRVERHSFSLPLTYDVDGEKVSCEMTGDGWVKPVTKANASP